MRGRERKVKQGREREVYVREGANNCNQCKSIGLIQSRKIRAFVICLMYAIRSMAEHLMLSKQEPI